MSHRVADAGDEATPASLVGYATQIPGDTDQEADICVSIEALRALERAGLGSHGSISTSFVCDGESAQPYAGSIKANGSPAQLSSADVARELGIETFDQRVAVRNTLDVAENRVLSREVTRGGVVGSAIGSLDETAAACGPEQTDRTLGLIGDLRNDGAAVVPITHNMQGATNVSDTAAVLRKGRTSAGVDAEVVNKVHLVAYIKLARSAEQRSL